MSSSITYFQAPSYLPRLSHPVSRYARNGAVFFCDMSSSSDCSSNDPNIIYGGPLPATYNRGCRSLGELVVQELSRDPGKVALINGVTGLQLTNGGILEQSFCIADHLRGLGVGKNDVVAVVSENRFEYPIAICGAYLLGAAAALFNPGYTERTLIVLSYLVCLITDG